MNCQKKRTQITYNRRYDEPATIDNIDLGSLPVTEISQHLQVENIPLEETKQTIDTLDIESLPVLDSEQNNLIVEDLNPPPEPEPELTLDNIDIDSIPVNDNISLEVDNTMRFPEICY